MQITLEVSRGKQLLRLCDGGVPELHAQNRHRYDGLGEAGAVGLVNKVPNVDRAIEL